MEAKNFIEEIINKDLESGKISCVKTRFPPEPNGYLHIGHAKALCVNFGLKQKYGGTCNLRYDDTNPVKEDEEYVNAIEEDIRWLGFEWDEKLFASDYFDRMFECAVGLIKKGLAYVCDLSAEQIRETRGTLTSPGRNSPFRNRSVEENLDLFMRMKAGEFADGEKVLRAKSTWRQAISICATPSYTASCTQDTTTRATSGAYIRCTTLRIPSRTLWRA